MNTTRSRPAIRHVSGMPAGGFARVREGTYRLLSQAFLYPDDERRAGLEAGAEEILRESDALAQFAFFADWRRLVELLRHADQALHPGIEERYIGLFAASAGGVPCPPYESAYREAPGRPVGWLLAQIEGAYAAAGLAQSEDLGEMPDHVAIEFEFMAVLCGQEAEAWEEEDIVGAARSLRAEKRFLNQHLGLWLPVFARRVAAADKEGFYRAISVAAQAFVGYDKDFLGALLESLPTDDQAQSQGNSHKNGSTR